MKEDFKTAMLGGNQPQTAIDEIVSENTALKARIKKLEEGIGKAASKEVNSNMAHYQLTNNVHEMWQQWNRVYGHLQTLLSGGQEK